MNFEQEKVAAVTGGTGLIGEFLIEKLLQSNWKVRVLSRTDKIKKSSQLTVVTSDINNENGLKKLLEGVKVIFHCASELNNVNKMYETNVAGTRKLIDIVATTKASYLCYISSAGVTGPTSNQIVDENIKCNPSNLYEKTKYEAEKIVLNANLDMNICILRPTNVISYNRPGILDLCINKSFKNRMSIIMKGKEKARIVNVNDVVDAALYFINDEKISTQIYFVSIDEDEHNTIAGIYNMYNNLKNNTANNIKYSLPVSIPHILRLIFKGNRLHGSVIFTSEKLLNTGFKYKYNVEKCILDLRNE